MLGETEMGRSEPGSEQSWIWDFGVAFACLGCWDETKTRHSPRPRKADSPKPPSTQGKRHLISCLSALRRRG